MKWKLEAEKKTREDRRCRHKSCRELSRFRDLGQRKHTESAFESLVRGGLTRDFLTNNTHLLERAWDSRMSLPAYCT